MFTSVKSEILPYQSVLELEVCLNYTTFASYSTISQILELTECKKPVDYVLFPGFGTKM